MNERGRRPPLWLAPVLGGLGVGLCVTAVLSEVAEGADLRDLAVILVMTAFVLTLSLALFIMQQGWRSTADRIHDLEQQLVQQGHALSEAESRDSLTGLPNRVALYEILELEFEQAVRTDRSLSCILLDIDHFRQVNDRHGYHFGDTVLNRLTRMLMRLLRGEDRVCRYGGDEFVILLTETDGRQALKVAERVHRQLKREVFSDGTAATAVSASFDIATRTAESVTRPNQMIERVEAALAEAKRGGRDRIAIDPAALVDPAHNGETPESTLVEQRPERRQSDRKGFLDA